MFMKKRMTLGLIIAAILIVVILAIGFATAIYVTPYYIYSKILNKGISHEFLTLSKAPLQLIFPTRFVKGDNDGDVFQGQDNLWGNFHLGNFLVPMPLHHPSFIMVPNITYSLEDFKKIRLGMTFVEPYTKRTYVSFLTGDNFSLELEVGKQKIFNLPVFKKYIEEKNPQVLWQDLFTMDLTGGIKSYELGGDLSQLLLNAQRFWKTPMEEWVYRLYILEKRAEFFKGEIVSIDFNPKNNLGIAKIESKSSRMLREVIYLPEGKNVYTIHFQTYPWDILSRAIRKKFLETLEFKISSPDSGHALYNIYSRLPYHIKVDQEALVYLFSAWSHQTDSKEYLKMVIRFLERGKDNKMQTTPFYEFAYRRFGTNFSTREDTIKESIESRLKRKTSEEFEKELSSEERKKLPDMDGNFQSEEAKMNYYLNKAKEKGPNNDESNKSSLDE